MIVGFNFNKISIERKNKPVQKMNVRYNIDFPDVREEAFPLKTKQKGVSFDFKFSVNYDPNVALIGIEGTIGYIGTEEQIGKIVETWKKNKKIQKDILVDVTNLALHKCHIKAFELSQDLNLPAHLPMPSVKVGGKEEKPENYIG
tara:strand:+ start:152 stop:586 length:435 start_codon:yes stop_codon:yes gene_type:complete